MSATAYKLSADILLLSGDRQAAGISHGDEIAEMPELHHNLLCVAHPCPAGMGPTYKVFLKRASDPYSKMAFYARSAREAGPIPIPNTMKALCMYKGIGASLMLLLTLTTGIGSAMAQSTSGDPPKAGSMETDIKKIKETMLGNWESIAPEIRPSKNPDGSLKPFYLKRAFKYLPSDRFELDVVNSADPYGAVPLAKIRIVGHMFWQGPHPIAPGAQKVDFVADEAYEVTPLVQGFADVLNKVASAGYAPWAVNSSQSIFGRSFAPFGLKEGTNFMEYDLVYLRGDLLFWGARNIDGRGFDTEQNRPTNLQIPLIRK